MVEQSLPGDAVRGPLEEAARLLPHRFKTGASPVLAGPLEPSWGAYREFLDNNELGLAWEMLAEVASGEVLDAAFWRQLTRAAEAIGDNQKAAYARQRVD